MADDVDEKFDASEPAIPSVSEANAELRRIATVRADEAFGAMEQRAEKLYQQLVMMTIEVHNWIGLLRELREKEGKQ